MFVLFSMVTACATKPAKESDEIAKRLFKGDVGSIYANKEFISADQAVLITKKYFNFIENPESNMVSKNDKKTDNSQLQDWISPEFIKLYNESSDVNKMALRNDMIDDIIILSDYYFQKYRTNTFALRKSTDMTFDTYSSILSSTAALTTGGMTPNILSGIAGLFTGMKNNYNKAMFAEQTAESVINIMQANRLNKQAEIIEKKSNPISQYTMRSAFRDLLDMHQEGSLISAVTSLQKTTGDMELKAKNNLKTVKAGS